MASELSLSILIGASAGAAMSVFGNLKGVMQRISDATRELKTNQNELGRQIKASADLPQPDLDRLNAKYKEQEQLLGRLFQSTKELGRAQAAIAANEAKRSELRGKMMETAGLVYMAAAPVKVAMEAEEAFADVKKVVDERVPELEAYLIDASRRIPQSFAELSQIASGGAQGGILRDELEGYIDLVAKMSVAGDLTSEFAGESVAKIKNIFSANIERMGELGDVINNLSNRESAKYAQIIDVLKRSGSTAQMFGFNERQAAGLSTAFLALGKTEETAGTAINAMLLKLSAADVQAPKFQKALKKMGLSARALKKAIGQDAEGALTMFLEKVRQLPKEKQLGVMSQMFGIQYADDVALLAQNIDVYKRVMREAGDATQYAGSMEKEFAARSATTKNAFILLKNALTALSITLGHDLLPAMKSLIEGIVPLVDRISKWIAKHPVLVSVLLKTVAGLLAFKVVLLTISYAFLLLYAPILHVGKALAIIKGLKVIKEAQGWAAALSLVFPKLFAVGKAFLWIGRALFLNPIGIALMTIAFIATTLYAHWDAVMEIVNGAKRMFAGWGKWWVDLWGSLKVAGAAAIDAFSKRWSELKEIFFRDWTLIQPFFLGFWEEVKSAFDSGIAGIAALILNWSPLGLFYRAFAGVFSWFGIELPAKFSEFGANLLSGLIDGITSRAAALKESLGTAIGDGIAAVKEKLGIHSPSRVFMEIGGNTMQGLRQGIEAAGAPIEALRKMAGSLVTSAALALPAQAALPPPHPLPLVSAAPAGARPASSQPDAAPATVTINVSVYPTPGMDERALAGLVARKIKEVQFAGEARARSRLYDAD
jgi:TP901 family phage tail tape measure protein